jgi:hypothetical protein
MNRQKRETVVWLLVHPSSSRISSTSKLERSTGFNRTNHHRCTGFNRTNHHRWGWTSGWIMHRTRLSPRNGIGSHHHPYARFKVDNTKGITKVQGYKLGFPLHAHHQICFLLNSELGPWWHPGLPVHTYLSKLPSRCENSRFSHLNCPREVTTRGR